MLKDILEINGVQELTKARQETIKGGSTYVFTCSFSDRTFWTATTCIYSVYQELRQRCIRQQQNDGPQDNL